MCICRCVCLGWSINTWQLVHTSDLPFVKTRFPIVISLIFVGRGSSEGVASR